MTTGIDRYRRAKRRADLTLFGALGVAVVGVLMRDHPIGRHVAILGEAAFVAGCADWFAITALFAHPWGVRIPFLSRHTAIIPRQRKEIGQGLRDLVERELLPASQIRRWIGSLDLVGEALKTTEGDARGFAERTFAWLRTTALSVPLDRAAEFVHRAAMEWIKKRPLAPLLRGAIRRILDLPGAETWIEKMLVRARESVETEAFRRSMEDLLKKEIRGEEKEKTGILGRFAGFVRRAAVDFGERRGAIDYADLAARFQSELATELAGMHSADHPVRKELRSRLQKLADATVEDPALAADIERWKESLIARTDLRHEVKTVLEWFARKLESEAEGGGLAFSRWAKATAEREIERLRSDAPARAAANRWLTGAAERHVDRLYSALLDLIVDGFERRLPGDRLVLFVQEHVGDALQDLRIVSTVVGALVGWLVYAVATIVRP